MSLCWTRPGCPSWIRHRTCNPLWDKHHPRTQLGFHADDGEDRCEDASEVGVTRGLEHSLPLQLLTASSLSRTNLLEFSCACFAWFVPKSPSLPSIQHPPLIVAKACSENLNATQYDEFHPTKRARIVVVVDFTFIITLATLSSARSSWIIILNLVEMRRLGFPWTGARDTTIWSNCTVSFRRACNMCTWKTNATICFWSSKFTIHSKSCLTSEGQRGSSVVRCYMHNFKAECYVDPKRFVWEKKGYHACTCTIHVKLTRSQNI